MIQMTESQMEDHIKSSSWRYVNSLRQGSEDYNSNIGVLRVLFVLGDDPSEIHTLISDTRKEIWIKYGETWNNLFTC